MPTIIYKQGAIFKIRFFPQDEPQKAFEKYVVCLQEGEIPTHSRRFTAVAITSKKESERWRMYDWDVEIVPGDSALPSF